MCAIVNIANTLCLATADELNEGWKSADEAVFVSVAWVLKVNGYPRPCEALAVMLEQATGPVSI